MIFIVVVVVVHYHLKKKNEDDYFVEDLINKETLLKYNKQEYPKLVIIFLGDYVSTHGLITQKQQIDNLERILQYKEENPDEIVSDEDIYAATDAFSPVDHFGFAMMYFETLKVDLAKKINDANDNFFRCVEEVKLETERLNTARTSMEISEIRSDIACANIAMHKAKTHESSVLAQVKNVQENYEKLLKSMQQYYVNLNENLDESDYLNLIRDNKQGKPE